MERRRLGRGRRSDPSGRRCTHAGTSGQRPDRRRVYRAHVGPRPPHALGQLVPVAARPAGTARYTAAGGRGNPGNPGPDRSARPDRAQGSRCAAGAQHSLPSYAPPRGEVRHQRRNGRRDGRAHPPSRAADWPRYKITAPIVGRHRKRPRSTGKGRMARAALAGPTATVRFEPSCRTTNEQ